jgi:ubiquinone/menaquinone biosynthesis C-methylase UbiE
MTRAQLDKKPAEVSAMFDRVADRYDALNDALSLGLDRHWRQVVARAVGASPGQLVLDLAAGTGTSSRAFTATGARCVACDFSLGMLQVGARRPGPAGAASLLEFVAGDALALPFEDGAFDLVCEFGVLHHIKTPARAVGEMLRVAKKAVFIADSNNFGQGSVFARTIKQTFNALGLWPLVDFIKTRGRGYTISEGDGLAYSYSVFNDYGQIRAQCKSVHLVNLRDAGVNPYRTATHVALLGVKQ